MRYTVYKITNIINNKIYIGKHQTETPNDQYYGSGKAIRDAIKKHGKENFIKEILFDFDTEDEMNLKERELITEEFVAREDTYNLGVGGEGGAHFKGKTHSYEVREKIKHYNKNVRDYSKVRGKASHKRGKKDSLETRIRKSEAAKNKYCGESSEEVKRKISESLKRYHAENADLIKEKRKHRKKNYRPQSEETKRKISERMHEYWENKKQAALITV